LGQLLGRLLNDSFQVRGVEKRTTKAQPFDRQEPFYLADIPEMLAEAHDRDEVVFFCGAGISLPASLPDFGRLADTLLDNLTAESSRKVREGGQSLDYVFKEMVKEFGSAPVTCLSP
jgi:hypothetical protein